MMETRLKKQSEEQEIGSGESVETSELHYSHMLTNFNNSFRQCLFCRFCGVDYASTNKHMKEVHINKGTTFACILCPYLKEYKTIYNLLALTENKHFGKNNHECSVPCHYCEP